MENRMEIYFEFHQNSSERKENQTEAIFEEVIKKQLTTNGKTPTCRFKKLNEYQESNYFTKIHTQTYNSDCASERNKRKRKERRKQRKEGKKGGMEEGK